MQYRHLEKTNDVVEDCFLSPIVIIVKSDELVKIASDSRKLKASCIKMRPHMPNVRDLLNQIAVEKKTNIDLDYAHGKTKLSEETTRQCVFTLTRKHAADTTSPKRVFRTCRHTQTIPRKTDRTLG